MSSFILLLLIRQFNVLACQPFTILITFVLFKCHIDYSCRLILFCQLKIAFLLEMMHITFSITTLFFFFHLQKYAKYVGLKRDFRLVVRGAARNMAPILKGSCNALILISSSWLQSWLSKKKKDKIGYFFREFAEDLHIISLIGRE